MPTASNSGPRGYLGEMAGLRGELALALALAPRVLALAVPRRAAPAAPVVPPSRAEPMPTCAEGPTRVGEVILGTPCADRIVVPPSVATVDGGPGDDTIVGSINTAASAHRRSRPPAATSKSAARPSKAAPATTSSTATAATTPCAATPATTASTAGSATTCSKAAPATTCSPAASAPTRSTAAKATTTSAATRTIDHIFDTGGGDDTLSFATG